MTDPFEIPVLAFFFLVGGLWLCTAIMNARVCRLFVERLPDAARKSIPALGSGLRDPNALLFFLKRRSDLILRQDPDVWALTRRFRLMTLLSVVVPTGGFVALAVTAYILSQQTT